MHAELFHSEFNVVRHAGEQRARFAKRPDAHSNSSLDHGGSLAGSSGSAFPHERWPLRRAAHIRRRGLGLKLEYKCATVVPKLKDYEPSVHRFGKSARFAPPHIARH